MSRKQSGTSSRAQEKSTSKLTKATTGSAKKVKSISHSGQKQKRRQPSPSPTPPRESESDDDSQKDKAPRKKNKKLTHGKKPIEEIIVYEDNEVQTSKWNGDEIILDPLSDDEVSM